MARVLVIDDNLDMRELVQIMLEGAGYDVELAADGEEGLAAQRKQPADVVITDLFMPNQDGFETIVLLRAEFPSICVIAVSGGGNMLRAKNYLHVARDIGAHAVLPKPFDQDVLLATVRRLLLERSES